ncbi:uncharacterized, partial [Tachysurus ichikawai]
NKDVQQSRIKASGHARVCESFTVPLELKEMKAKKEEKEEKSITSVGDLRDPDVDRNIL